MAAKRKADYTPPTDLISQMNEMHFLLQDCAEWLAVLQSEYNNHYRIYAKLKMSELSAKAMKLRRQLDDITPIEYKRRSNYEPKEK